MPQCCALDRVEVDQKTRVGKLYQPPKPHTLLNMHEIMRFDMTEIYYQAPRTTLQHANTRMLNRYMPWIQYMLTITFGKDNLRLLPDQESASKQLRHLGQALNSSVWGHRSRKNAKCNILFVPIVEGGTDTKRIHAHVLIGNVKCDTEVRRFMQGYIPRSYWLASDFDVRPVSMADGLAWYVGKELNYINDAAIAWDIAAIPKPLRPR
jgi:hypothetical protein